MKLVISLITGALIIIMLTSCAYIQRQTRLVHETWPKDQCYVAHDYQLSELPAINLRCSCSDETTAFIGPYIAVPLPVVPNVFWPLERLKYKKIPANFFLTIKTPPKMLNWNNISIEISINEKTLALHECKDFSNVWTDEREYIYFSGITCGELEGSEIIVKVTGIPETIETKLLCTFRWRLYTDLI